MQQTVRVKVASDPDVIADVDVAYEDDGWMEEARRGLTMAAMLIVHTSQLSAQPTPKKRKRNG